MGIALIFGGVEITQMNEYRVNNIINNYERRRIFLFSSYMYYLVQL